jgi:undecaprenyl-diphosphatase
MIAHLGQWISEYGYVIVAVFIFFEGMAIPFPTDTTIVTAAAFAAHGRLSVAAVFFISAAATTAGTTVAFAGGRRGGEFFERHSRKVNPAVLERTRRFFDRHGALAVVVGRFVPLARMLISPLAGVSMMSPGRFTLFNAIGAIIWSALFCSVGFFFGQHPPAFGHGLVRAAFVVALGMAVVVTVLVAGGWLVEESDAAWRAEGTLWHRVLMTAPLRWLAARSPAARAFLFRRFTPGDYLGLNLTLGLGLSFVALIVFSSITSSVISRDAVPRFDRELWLALRETATPERLAFWRRMADFGRLPLVAAGGLFLASFLSYRRNSRLPLTGFVAAFLGSSLLDVVVSRFLAHPHVAATARSAAQFGAPSGQALGSLVGYGMIAYFLILLTPDTRLHVAIVVSAVIAIATICFARLYIGDKFFSDIVSGLSAGGVWLAACLTGLEVARRRSLLPARSSPLTESDASG